MVLQVAKPSRGVSDGTRHGGHQARTRVGTTCIGEWLKRGVRGDLRGVAFAAEAATEGDEAMFTRFIWDCLPYLTGSGEEAHQFFTKEYSCRAALLKIIQHAVDIFIHPPLVGLGHAGSQHPVLQPTVARG
jgi:hypothetical protein